MRFRYSILLFGWLLAGAAGCSDSTSPDGTDRPPGELNIIRLSGASPAIFEPEQSFYAVQGEDREIRISFQDPETGGEGEEFFRLRVRPASLQSLPDGSPFPS